MKRADEVLILHAQVRELDRRLAAIECHLVAASRPALAFPLLRDEAPLPPRRRPDRVLYVVPRRG